MSNPGQELSSIDFASLIGGPLTAVIKAQAQSSNASVQFIKGVGFKKPLTDEFDSVGNSETEEPIYVKFKYPKEVTPYVPSQLEVTDGEGNVVTPATPAASAVYETHEISVPILTMLPIPFIRIEEATLDFNAKITSMAYDREAVTKNTSAGGGAKTGKFFSYFGSASLKASTSTKRVSRTGTTENKTYSMAVHVRAVQDEMPAGMERLLGILEDSVKSQPVPS
jgi:hypothetical protein